ncbi:MAG: prepilin-type N-terminal cleavage/methylation domain-containing protein [Armatimonadota bacterium]
MVSYHVNKRVTSPRGFTLIELLVVIAIIAVLAAILFPVFARAREKAYQNQCLNNQRQFAVALLASAQDHEEAFPLPSQWVEATGLSGDPKVFDCPTSAKVGTPSDPDYGMNAFLYDLGKDGVSLVPVKMASIEDPTRIELTTDLKRMTSAGAVDADPVRQALKDQFANPFPKTYTVTGYTVLGTGDARHQSGCIASFADGHVKLLKGLEMGNGKTGYSIPRSGWRFFVNFNECKDKDDAKRRLNSYFAVGPGSVYDGAGTYANGIGVGWFWNPSSKTLDIQGTAGGIGLKTNCIAMAYDAACFGTTNQLNNHSFAVDFTLTDGGMVSVGGGYRYGQSAAILATTAVWPATSVAERERETHSRPVFIDTANNWVQFGQLKGFSMAPGLYSGYTAGTWTNVPRAVQGKRTNIATSTSRFVVETDYSMGGNVVQFPTDSAKPYWTQLNAGGGETWNWSCVVGARQNTTVKMPGSTPALVSHEGSFLPFSYQTNYHQYIHCYNAVMKINTLYYSGGN